LLCIGMVMFDFYVYCSIHPIDNPCQAEAMCNNSGSIFGTKESLQAAVNDYISDQEAGIILYGRMNCWDVGAITDMGYLFQDKYSMNEDISCWDVSNVTDMGNMFFRAFSFNQDVGRWNVSNVENMNSMFGRHWWDWGSVIFNHNIGEWNVSKVKFMSGMFYHASAFNQDLSRWNVSQALDLSYMFYGATAFNQNLCDWYASFSTDLPVVSHMFSSSGCQIELLPNLLGKVTFCQKCNFEGNISKKGNVLVFCFYLFCCALEW
jgi:surface protein